MRPALFPPRSDDEPRLLRRRASALVFTILAHLLLFLLLLSLAPKVFVPMKQGGSLVTFSVNPSVQEQPSRAKAAAAAKQRPAATTPPPPATIVPPPLPVPVPTPPHPPVQIIELSRSEMSSVDTAMNTPHAAGPVGQAAEAGAGDDSGDTPSTMGPKGERLYAAEWYREPTRAEMETYLPRHVVPPVSGTIACQTVARFHVDNCYELGDSQPGAGIARAMRQAAFQFLVRPPRVGGHLMVGAWVTIRYTLLPARGGDETP